ncbi:MAG: tripartite ATP-independent periplasmic transporter dctq component [Firmicutes bacterium]|nr:tripartite ATP-independent periplasmic transporter dctq component [Bacillota bacterium]
MLLFKEYVYKLSASLNLIGLSLTLVMVATVVVDIFGRALFNIPLQGSYELVECIMGLVIVFAIGYTQVRNSHINVPGVIELLPQSGQRTANAVVNLIGFVTYSLFAWQAFIKAGTEIKAQTVSAVLAIPKYPFLYACAFGFGVLALVYLAQAFAPDEVEESDETEIGV